jgi:hypothetical protein
MSTNSLTPWDYALLTKALLRDALAFYCITHAMLARMLGLESAARVDAALSDARDNQVPLWWLLHPGFPAQVRAHVFEEIARRTAVAPPAADTPERQVMVALIRVGQFVSTASATMTHDITARIDAEPAAQLLRVVEGAASALGGLASRLRQRVATGRHATKGGAA